MAPPLQFFTIGAVAGAIFNAVYLQPHTSRLQSALIFVALYISQFVVWALWRTFVYPHYISPLRHLPNPAGGHWLFGQSQTVIRDGFGTSCRKWLSQMEHNGFIRVLLAFNREVLVVSSPPALAEVLVSKSYDFEKPLFLREILATAIGNGLINSEGDRHKVQRRNLMPAFSFRHIKDLYPIFWQKSREVVQVMTDEHERNGRNVFEVSSWASRVTLDIIGSAGLGRDFQAIHDEHNELVKTYMCISSPSRRDRTIMTLADFFGYIIPVRYLRHAPFKRAREMRAAANTVRAVCLDLIKSKKEKLAKNALVDVDILSIALKSGVFSDEELVDQLMTFLAAGHETTASALTWAIYALCRHPNVQKRLRDEVRQNLPVLDSEIDATSQEIDHMPYLQAVCNEVLRIYSPVPQTLREAVRDTTIQNETIKRGTRILLAPWGTNSDVALWGPDAHEFKPERWLSVVDGGSSQSVKSAANGGATSNYAFLSFLHGPRSCIGQSFAKAEFACLLAAWVGRFEFEMENHAHLDEANLVIEQLVTVKAVDGLFVKLSVVPGY